MERIKILDGAMGTWLQEKGVFKDPALLNEENPDLVGSVHKAYLDAGADILYANSFGCNGIKFKDKDRLRALIHAALKEAKKQAGTGAQVALDLGPLGQLLKPMGTLDFEEAYNLFAENVRYGLEVGFDLVVIETMSSLLELRAAILAVRDNYEGPLLVSMTFEEDGRTFAGVSPKAFGVMADALGVTALGVNCSLGPFEMKPVLEEIREVTDLPLLVKANAGLPDEEGHYSMSDEDFLQGMEDLFSLGVHYIGGCCGTSPSTIALLRDRFKDRTPAKIPPKKGPYLASSSKVLRLDRPLFVGESINPAGRQNLKESLLRGDMEEALRLALDQEEAGADLLDLNVSLPGTDEAQNLRDLVLRVQSLTNCPLQLDSSNPRALEEGLRVCAGRPVLNSLSGKAASMEEVFPLAKKYGALVIGLCLDEGGIPKTAEERLEIGKKIVREGEKYGFSKEEIFLDPLVLTLASDKDAGKVALETIELFTKEGYLTTMGTSNISFGLPHRSVLTSNFLLLGLDRGCKLPIVNPLDPRIQEVLASFQLIRGRDPGAENYLALLAGLEKKTGQVETGEDFSVYEAMGRSQKSQLVAYVKKALEDREAMEIIEEDLIPALDRIGRDYEEEKIYLPQLIGAASTAQEAFAYLREKLRAEKGEDRGEKILLATVKGDIHDIGKNIAKVLLENYGYRVYDLGRDVSKEKILAGLQKEKIRLVGLSALMTTTVKNMEETIRYLKEHMEEVQIMVAGAVLTENYARKIGADYYCRDAGEDVEVARRVFGEKEK